jgi:predicted ATPase
MFTQLRIQNFKSWADTGEFRMAPLTGFFGANSSGKTAILQFLLMLKQTVESSDRNRILHLGGDQYSYVDLGTTYDISHRHQFPEKIKFLLTWLPKQVTHNFSRILNNPENVGPSVSFYSNYKEPIRFESEIDVDIDQISVDFFKYSFKLGEHQWNEVGITSLKADNQDISYQLVTEGNPIINFRGNKIDLTNKLFGSTFECFKNYGFQTVEASTNLDKIIYHQYLVGMTKAYETLYQNTYYLAPLREYPKRTYLWSGESPQDVGRRGELTVAALLTSRKTDSEVEILVAKALKDLGLIHSFRLNRITPNRGDYEILVQKSPNSAEVLITDVGFGVSQVLPILVLCYYAPKGATLMFEQPEIHLHPSVQAGLADIFIEVIKTRNIQIIIESHSEHLLRRLQRRMAEEKDGFTNDDAALYFCKMNDQGDSELVTLDIDDYGNICNYPEGFFGDEMGDLVAMTEAAINRQMNIGV